MKINWLKSIEFGAIIFAVAYFTAMIFVVTKIDTTGILPWLVISSIAVITTYLLAKKLEIKATNEALVYGAIWVITIVVLDYLFTKPFTGIEFFYNWKTWVSYVLIFLVPVVSLNMGKK